MTSDDLQSLADRAIADYRAGRLDAAERGFREILDRDPGNARMMSNLGVLLSARRDFAGALPYLETATVAEPANPRTWTAWLAALIGAGRFDVAERAIAERSDLGPIATAAEVRLRHGWGRRLFLDGQPQAAEPHLERARALAPDSPAVLMELARVRLALGRPAEALPDLERAVDLAPDHLAAVLNLAAACKTLGRAADAEAHYRRGLALDPVNGHALRNLRILLVEQRRHDEALAAADAALAAGATSGEAHLARGVALAGLGRDAEAVPALEAALAGGCDRVEALTTLSLSQSLRGGYEAALAAIDAAVQLRPDDVDLLARRASTRLRLLDFAGGWRDYEARWRNPAFLAQAGSWAPQVLDRIEADPAPEAVVGRRVLAIAEQGIGDQVMFASMLPDLIRDAREVACLADPRLVRLFANSFPDAEVLGFGEAAVSGADFDTAVGMGSLGRLYRNQLSDFPATPYLRPRDEVRARWRERLGPPPAGLRIGLSWRGGAAETRATARSIPLARLAPLLDLPGCELVSLQYGDPRPEVEAVNAARADPIRLFPPADIDDFEDLAALVAELDVVVTVQTALVHLCGAIGADCRVLVPHHAEWRYTAASPTLPWYGSVRLYRQGETADWTPVLAAVEATLRDRLRTRS